MEQHPEKARIVFVPDQNRALDGRYRALGKDGTFLEEFLQGGDAPTSIEDEEDGAALCPVTPSLSRWPRLPDDGRADEPDVADRVPQDGKGA
jgi:hypothetical protein